MSSLTGLEATTKNLPSIEDHSINANIEQLKGISDRMDQELLIGELLYSSKCVSSDTKEQLDSRQEQIKDA